MASRISKIWKSSPRRTRAATPWTCCKMILNFMIGRTRPRIRDRQPPVENRVTAGRLWLLLGMACCAAAIAAPPPAPATPPPAASQPSSPGAPDDDFIEFLGADDVGDAAWWEFLKKAPPRGQSPPATAPQEAKQ